MISPVAGEGINVVAVLGISRPLVGLFISSMAEFAGGMFAVALIDMPPAWLIAPVVEDTNDDSSWNHKLPLKKLNWFVSELYISNPLAGDGIWLREAVVILGIRIPRFAACTSSIAELFGALPSLLMLTWAMHGKANAKSNDEINNDLFMGRFFKTWVQI